MTKPGDRVLAIYAIDPANRVIKVVGEGTFLGYRQPPIARAGVPRSEFIAKALELGLTRSAALEALSNPCIRLDSGQFVWGFQVWWGPVVGMEKRFSDYTREPAEIESFPPIDEEVRND